MPAIKPARGENPYAKTANWIAYCDLCGERFTRQKKNLDKSEGCYCSQSCRHEYARREKYGWHCPRCGEALEGKQDWCSYEECLKANTDQEDFTPVGRSRYRIRVGGVGPLPFDGELWEERRRAALERDGYRCRACGIDQREHRRQYGRALAVHHEVPRREFDTADEAHDLENLVTLCCRCHGRAESEDVEAAFEQFFQENEERLREIARDEIGKVLADA